MGSRISLNHHLVSTLQSGNSWTSTRANDDGDDRRSTGTPRWKEVRLSGDRSLPELLPAEIERRRRKPIERKAQRTNEKAAAEEVEILEERPKVDKGKGRDPSIVGIGIKAVSWADEVKKKQIAQAQEAVELGETMEMVRLRAASVSRLR
jgi:hypothetical protein